MLQANTLESRELQSLSWEIVTEQRGVGNKAELERVMGIEPTTDAWEASVLPLNYTRPDGEVCI